MSVERGKWDNKLHFLVTCLGFATGLGNLWRFPALAYENGGAAFLIPYVVCSFLIGFPILYLELTIGQFTSRGPARCFRYFKPVLQGVGWASAIMAYVVGIYYNMINVHSAIYIIYSIIGKSSYWLSCRNSWNSQYCQSSLEDTTCSTDTNGTLPYYFNFTCNEASFSDVVNQGIEKGTILPAVSPSEEFFESYVYYKNDGIESFGGMNWLLFVGFFLIWVQTALTLMKGVEWIGKITMVTATLPFLMITAILIRAITLDGALLGLQFFVTQPDWSYVYSVETWVKAAVQICYTLGIAYGGLLSLASFNDSHHNCYKDAIIVVGFDSFMSIFGGSAAFCSMGVLAKQSNLPLNQVIQSGTALTFIAYPEAMGRMPLPALWTILFFLMFFFLGVSSQFATTEAIITAVCDQFPTLHKKKPWVVIGVCGTCFLLGLPLCTRSGIYWFDLMNEYAGTFALFIVAALEVITVAYLYGIREYVKDLRDMMGAPTTFMGRWFGSSGYYIVFTWVVFAPIILSILFVISLREYFGYHMTYGKAPRLYTYPEWSDVVGWMLAIVPLLAIPFFFIFNIISFQRSHNNWREAFKIQPKLKSYVRLRGLIAQPTQISFVSGQDLPWNTEISDAEEQSFEKHRQPQ